ncbi:MAG: hypothetical protein GDA44_14680 [Prochloron sp. SP5CPC1]|nr:hypothetical protein [Candidatus Paraprochloron terpiosi SP5CPC1]
MPFASGTNKFELFADNDNNFNNEGKTTLGTFNANMASSAQIFRFIPTPTQFVHLNIISNHGATETNIGK